MSEQALSIKTRRVWTCLHATSRLDNSGPAIPVLFEIRNGSMCLRIENCARIRPDDCLFRNMHGAARFGRVYTLYIRGAIQASTRKYSKTPYCPLSIVYDISLYMFKMASNLSHEGYTCNSESIGTFCIAMQAGSLDVRVNLVECSPPFFVSCLSELADVLASCP